MAMSEDRTQTIDPKDIKGNCSEAVKGILSNPARFFQNRVAGLHSKPIFSEHIHNRLVVTEASIEKKREDEKKKEAIVVIELDVTEDMTNGGGGIHGGCIASLVDVTTTLVLVVYSLEVDQKFFAGVSQSISVVYHSPAMVGDRLRIVNYTVAGGSRARTARCELWNATHHRLVASGTHIKMAPSEPKANL